MAQQLGKLNSLFVSRAAPKGLYCDGGGLYLQVSESGAKSWIFKFKLDGRAREMGLGPLNAIGLADARARAAECRKQRHDGIDPIEARKLQRAQERLKRAKSITFRQAAEAYIASQKEAWKNPKSEAQWKSTFVAYAYPVFGDLPVQAIDNDLVMKVIEPIWVSKTTTAARLRARIEAVLDWATVSKYRSGENPARWKGNIDKLLPRKSRVHKVTHHAALPYTEIADFMAKLKALEGTTFRAAELAILTATRSTEVREAEWDEFDEVNKVWKIPAVRMKGGKEHRVPLSEPALAVLAAMKKVRQNKYVFPGRRKGKPVSTLDTVLDAMDRKDLTMHGMRSAFRDWGAECRNYANELLEMALAHAIEDETEAAYRRGTMFLKRRKVMNDWAKYCYAQNVRGQVFDMRASA